MSADAVFMCLTNTVYGIYVFGLLIGLVCLLILRWCVFLYPDVVKATTVATAVQLCLPMH